MNRLPDLAEADELARQIRAVREEADHLGPAFPSGGAGSSQFGSAGDPPPGLLPADFVPGYCFLREIHRGGQGVVYEATQLSTRRRVAIKVVRPSATNPAATHARFEREAELLTQLRHPNIVTVHDAGVAANAFFIVMDFVDGVPLDQFVRQQLARTPHRGESPRSRIESTLQLFGCICDAVNAAHLRGIIHRDLKPANILVDQEGAPRVLDFGLAKLVGDPTRKSSCNAETLSTPGGFFGSLPWASPEQAAGEHERIDIRTDVYSLGVILYQMLTGGRFPYDVSGPVRDVLNRIVTAEPARCGTIAPGCQALASRIDGEVETIVRKCLEKSPTRRYQSAGNLAADVRRYLAGEAIEAKRDSRWYLLRKTLKRYRLPLGIAAAFIVLLAGGLLGTLWMWQRAAAGEAESRRLAEFQAKVLTEFDPEIMGADQREDVLANAEHNWKRIGLAQSEIDARRTKLEALLGDVNFTSVALQTLSRNVFEGNLAAIRTEFADQPLVKAKLLQRLATTMVSYDLWDPAKQAQDEALDIRRRLLGEEHPDTLESMEQTAQWYVSRWSELEVAEPFARQVLEARLRTLGENHPDTLRARYLLGEVLRLIDGRLDEAAEVHRAALAGRRAELRDEHVDTLCSIAALGWTLLQQRKLADAEPIVLELYQRAREVSGFERDYPGTAEALLGRLRQFQGRHKEAEQHYRTCLEQTRLRWGDARRNTRFVAKALGLMLQRQGRYAEAELIWESELPYFRRVKGPDDFETIHSMQLLALIRNKQGRWEEAANLSREGLALATSPEAKPYRVQLASVLYFALRGLEQYAEADSVAIDSVREVLRDFEAASVRADVPVLDTLHLFRLISSVEDGGDLRRDFVRLCHEKLGPTDLRTLDYKAKLAWQLSIRDRIDEAEQLSREALEGFNAAYVAPNEHWVNALRTRSEILLRLGRVDEALDVLEQEKRMHGAVGAAMGPRDAATFIRHGECLRLTGRFADAERELRECHEILTSDQSSEEKDIREVGEAMVKLLEAWHATEPDGGHDLRAEEWQSRLEKVTQPSE